MGRKKWHQKKYLHSHKPNTANLPAHTQLSCSTTMASRSPLRNSPPSLRPQETLLSHTGQCSSPRPSNPPTLVTSLLKLPQQAQLPVQPLLAVLPLLMLQRKRRRKKLKRMLIWEDFSETT